MSGQTELERTIEKLEDAIERAKTATSEANAATKDLRATEKRLHEFIRAEADEAARARVAIEMDKELAGLVAAAHAAMDQMRGEMHTEAAELVRSIKRAQARWA